MNTFIESLINQYLQIMRFINNRPMLYRRTMNLLSVLDGVAEDYPRSKARRTPHYLYTGVTNGYRLCFCYL